MKNLGTVNEGSSASIELTFEDGSGVAVTPSAGSYRIDTGNGVSVRAATAFTPSASTHVLSLTALDNSVKDTNLALEPHIVTVTWTYATGTKVGTEECVYSVANLLYV